MNEFTAKKLAEAEAFYRISGAIVDRAGADFASEYNNIAATLKELSTKSTKSAIDSAMATVFAEKTDKTVQKLTRMMELYIGDEWDNPVEVLEWCSFFTGAAAAHLALASELTSDTRSQCDESRAIFEQTLQQVIAALRAVGASKRD